MHTQTTPFVVQRETSSYRPRIARETRRLLLTAFLALVALSVLARLRFDRPVTPNPVPPVLTQLASTPRFVDLASIVTDLRARVAPLLEVTAGVAALRIGDGVAVTTVAAEDGSVIAFDRASNLAIIRATDAVPGTIPLLWQPERLDDPHYFLAASADANGLTLRPVFVARLVPMETPRWDAPVWRLAATPELAAGSALFTENAELVGMVTRQDAGLAVVPARALLRAADTLRTRPFSATVEAGIEVQALTPALTAATGADIGVVVTWVDRSRIPARDLRPGDVIVVANQSPIVSVADWDVFTTRYAGGDTLLLHVLRDRMERDVSIAVLTPSAEDVPRPLGLTMRGIAGVGVEVIRVERASAAAAAGIQPRDLITSVGSDDAPTPARLRSAFAAADEGEVLIVGIARGTRHQVVGLAR